MKYGIISDIHSNTEALAEVLKKCEDVGVEKYICLGDIVGYNSNPRECLETIRSLDLVGCVKGNHDEYASNGDKELYGFNPHAKQAVLWTAEQLTDEQKEWLANLPMRQSLKGLNLTIVHATLDSPETWGYIFDAHQAADNFSYQFTQLCFCGHSHVPLAFCKEPVTMHPSAPISEERAWRFDDADFDIDQSVEDSVELKIEPGIKYLINIGSVGQPRNGDTRASFAIYDDKEKIVTRYMIPYDLKKTQQKILETGLPKRLAERLQYGN